MPSKRDSGLAPNPTITPRLLNSTHNTAPTSVGSFLIHYYLTHRAVSNAFDEIETSPSPHELSAAVILDATPALTARTVYIDIMLESLLHAGGDEAGVAWGSAREQLGVRGMEQKIKFEGQWSLEFAKLRSSRSGIAEELIICEHAELTPVAEFLVPLAQDLALAPNPERHMATSSDPETPESRHRLQTARELHVREKKARCKKAKKLRVREQKAQEREEEARGRNRVAMGVWKAPGLESAATVGFERMASAHVKLQRTVEVVQAAVKRMQQDRVERVEKMQEEREGWEEERKGVEVARAKARRNGQRVARLRREQEHRSWAILTKLEWGSMSDDEI